jgi:nucleoside 2-deoxyribosyltransferase
LRLTLKVYLASSFDLKDKVQQISEKLESKGIAITRKWWVKDYKTAFGQISDEAWYEKDIVRSISQANFRAIDEADALILVCPDDRVHKFVGANVEVGYAIARGKCVLSLGVISRSAMYVPVEQHRTMETVLKRLGRT